MLGNQVAGAISRQRIDKRFINLQNIDVERIEIVQVGITGTEIINSYLIARFAESLDHRRGFRHIDKPPFGDFNFDLLHANCIAARFLSDLCNQPRGVEIRGRKINRDIELRVSGQIFAKIVEQLVNYVICDLSNHA